MADAQTVAGDKGQAAIDVSIIIVSYNVGDFLQQCLHSLQKACGSLEVEIIVVDNASRDSSCQMVRDTFPWVHLIENGTNQGFSRANNQALRIARGRYVLLINPDTLVREDTLQALLDFMEHHPGAGATGCKILNPDGTLQLSCRRSFPTPWVALSKILGLGRLFPRSRLFGKYNLTYLDPDQVWEVDALSGSFLFLRRETLCQVGLLDEAYFMYGEDLDLCYRIKKAGWNIYYTPATQIIHYKGKSTETSASTVLDFYRAMYIFVKKHLRRRYLFFLHWFLILGIAIRAFISFLDQFIRRDFDLLLDAVLVNIAFMAAILLRFRGFIPLPPFQNEFSYLLIHGICSLIWVGSLWSLGLYDRRRYSPVQAIWAITLGFLLISTLTYFKKEYAFSRIAIFTSYVLSLALVAGWRVLFRLVAKTAVGQVLVFRRAVVVGANEAGAAIVGRLRGRLDLGSRVVGFIRCSPADGYDSLIGLPVLGDIQRLPQIVEQQKIHEVIVTTSAQSYADILELVAACAPSKVDFKLVPSTYEVMIGGAQIDRIDDIPLVEIRYRPLLPWNRTVKRVIDVIISFLLLILTAPLAFIWIFLHHLRPDRYRSEKVTIGGKGNKPITIRTFQIVAPGGKGSGRFRRFHYRWALDRWPILISIFRGELSLVGPEPKKLGRSKISVLKPGLTGFVQVHLPGNLTPEEVEEYEIYYMRNQSLMLDVQIFWKALWDVVRGQRKSSSGPPSGPDNSCGTIRTGLVAGNERIKDERVRSRF